MPTTLDLRKDTMMNIAFYSDLAAFQQQAAPLLKSHCAVNSLKLGLLEYYCNHEERSGNPVFAAGIEHGEVIAVFIRTRSLYFFVNEAYFEEIIPRAIEEFLKRQIILGIGDPASMSQVPGDLSSLSVETEC